MRVSPVYLLPLSFPHGSQLVGSIANDLMASDAIRMNAIAPVTTVVH